MLHGAAHTPLWVTSAQFCPAKTRCEGKQPVTLKRMGLRLASYSLPADLLQTMHVWSKGDAPPGWLHSAL